MNTYEVHPEEFSNADRFIAEPDLVLSKVTNDDAVNRREKECDLAHLFEEIFVEDWKDQISKLTEEERYNLIEKNLLEYNA